MTKKPTKTYQPFDVVRVPFPFTDQHAQKVRPALILSSVQYFNHQIEHSVMAMITSSSHTPWPLDIHIRNLRIAGLASPSLVRMKLFTLDHRLILGKLGELARPDQQQVRQSLQTLFPLQS